MWVFERDWVTVSRLAGTREGKSATHPLVQTKVGTGLRFAHPKLHPGSDILGSWLSLELGGLAGAPLMLLSSCGPRELSVLLLEAFLSSCSPNVQGLLQTETVGLLSPTARDVGIALSSRLCSTIDHVFCF